MLFRRLVVEKVVRSDAEFVCRNSTVSSGEIVWPVHANAKKAAAANIAAGQTQLHFETLASSLQIICCTSPIVCEPTANKSPSHTMASSADALFDDFAAAYEDPEGPQGNLLASTISPEAPKHDPGRLYNFRNGINQYSVRTDLQYKLQFNPVLQLSKKEASAWVDVFTLYHKFVGTLLQAEEAQNTGHGKDSDWPKVYEEWKEVVNALFRGYQTAGFGAWTIPCLYVGGKYLRIFAIKADAKIASQRDSGLAFGGIEEEDAFDPSSKDEKLEDAARQINRIFGLCVGDR